MKTISFVNMKGGVGKTTTALNVAHYLAHVKGKKVAVIDVDPQFNATQCLFTPEDYFQILKSGGDTILSVFDSGIAPLASVVSGANTPEIKGLADINLIKKGDLWVLPGNMDLYRLEMVSGEGKENSLKRFIDKAIASKNFDYVIIDTPPTPSMWMTSALIASDYYVIPVRPDPMSMIGIDLLRTIIERRRNMYDLGIKGLGVVFTMVERHDSIIFSNAKQNLAGNTQWKDRVFKAYILKRSELAKTQLSQPFIMLGSDFDLRNNLKAFVEEMLVKIDAT